MEMGIVKKFEITTVFTNSEINDLLNDIEKVFQKLDVKDHLTLENFRRTLSYNYKSSKGN